MVMKMAKYANAGELRTPVKFVSIVRTKDGDGYPVKKKSKWLKLNASGLTSTAQRFLLLCNNN